MIASFDCDIKASIQISKVSCLLDAYGYKMTIYYKQNKVEYANCQSQHINHNNLLNDGDNKIKCNTIK